jgi:hypothetical protein
MRRAVLIVVAAVVAVLVIAQLALPAIAEHSLRSRLDKFGHVTSVDVRAFPAITLLWKRADRVRVRMSDYRSGQDSLAGFLDKTRQTADLDVGVEQLTSGALTLRDVSLHKDGDELFGEAGVTVRDLRAALPPGLDVRPVGADENGIVFQGSASLFGVGAALRVRATVVDGGVRLQPDVPLGGLVGLGVFSDDRVEVTSLGGHPRADGYTLTAHARLVG